MDAGKCRVRVFRNQNEFLTIFIPAAFASFGSFAVSISCRRIKRIKRIIPAAFASFGSFAVSISCQRIKRIKRIISAAFASFGSFAVEILCRRMVRIERIFRIPHPFFRRNAKPPLGGWGSLSLLFFLIKFAHAKKKTYFCR